MTLTALEQYYTEQLDAMEWLGDTATFSGRLYIEVYDSTVEAPAWLQDIMQRYQMQIDEQGEFYDVAGEKLMLDDVAIYHDDKDVPTAAFIFDAHSKNGDEGNWKAAIDITAKAHEQLLLPDIKSPYAAEHGAYLLPVPVLRTVQRAFDTDNRLSADSLTKRHATELQEPTKPLRMSCVMFTDEQGRLFYLDDSEYLEGAFAGLAVIEAEKGFRKVAVKLSGTTCMDKNGQANPYFKQETISVLLETDSNISEVWYSEDNHEK